MDYHLICEITTLFHGITTLFPELPPYLKVQNSQFEGSSEGFVQKSVENVLEEALASQY